MSPEGLSRSPESKNIVELETINAYYRVVYEAHGDKHDKKIYENSDAILQEFGTKFNDISPETLVEIFRENNPTAVEYANSHQTPVFFVDSTSPGEITRNLSKLGAVAEMTAGVLLVKNVVEDINNPKPISRRKALEKIKTIGKAALAAHLISPGAGKLLGEGAYLSGTKSATGEIARGVYAYNETAHPETAGAIYSFRNLVMADNAETVAVSLNQRLKRKPKIVIIVGADHTRIEHDLSMNSEKRTDKINTSIFKQYYSNLDKIMSIKFTTEDGKLTALYDFLENPNIR